MSIILIIHPVDGIFKNNIELQEETDMTYSGIFKQQKEL